MDAAGITKFAGFLGREGPAQPMPRVTVDPLLDVLDRALKGAALSLGASRLAVFCRVTLPLIRPALAAAALFALIVSIDEFTLTLFISGRTIETIPLVIFNNTQYGMDPTVAAASTVLIAVSAVVIVLLERIVGLRTTYAVRR